MDGIRILVKVKQKKRASKRSVYYPVGLIACKRQYAWARIVATTLQTATPISNFSVHHAHAHNTMHVDCGASRRRP